MEVAHPHTGRFLVELEFENVGFEERGKPEYPEINLSEQGREPTTNSLSHMASTPGFEPGPHWLGGKCSHHRATLAPQREKKSACRVKVTNLSEQSFFFF